MTTAAPLGGRRIVVTRPAGEAGPLMAAIRAAGGEPLLFPAIDIGPAPDEAHARALLARLATFRFVVFISPTAVSAAFALLGPTGGWPAVDAAGRPRAAAVGPGTARVLAGYGVPDVLVPTTTFDSEGLLALPELAAVAGAGVLIVRGAGGRETLARTLEERGAVVTYAECYRRGPPAWPPAALAEPLLAGRVDAVIGLSAEALANLVAHLASVGTAARAALLGVRVVVPHVRVADAARRLGFTRVETAAGGEGGLVDALAGAC